MMLDGCIFFKSENNGEIRRSNWDDLNIPARMATLALSGIPMLQADNSGHIVATQSFVKKYNIGLLFKDLKELGQLIRNRELMMNLRKNVWNQRELFMFDHHVNALVEFFREVIAMKKTKGMKKEVMKRFYFLQFTKKLLQIKLIILSVNSIKNKTSLQ